MPRYHDTHSNDADGSYVRHWLPELKDVPTQCVHEPWKMSRADQEKYGCKIGTYNAPDTDYPNPPQSRFSYGDGLHSEHSEFEFM